MERTTSGSSLPRSVRTMIVVKAAMALIVADPGLAATKASPADDESPVITGDWSGDGRTSIGTVHGNTWYLRDVNHGGPADRTFAYGAPDDIAIAGDWNGDGTTTIGIVRGNTFHLRNANSGGAADVSFSYGRASDTPIAGDWNGDGITTVGVVRGSTWLVRNANRGGRADLAFTYGHAGDTPVTGDWNATGTTTVGAVRARTWLLRNANSGGPADLSFVYGPAPDPWAFLTVPLEVWESLAQCESGGNWSANTGNGYYGGLQFALSTWRWIGGTGYPHHHSKRHQIYKGEKLMQARGWGQWPACSRALGLR